MTAIQFLFGFVGVFLTVNCTTQRINEIFLSLDNTCADQCHSTVQGHSSLHCALRCTNEPKCVFSAWDSNLGLCKLCETYKKKNSTSPERFGLTGFTKMSCQNGGEMNMKRWSCDCVAGFAGKLCQRLIYDCSEGFKLNYPTGVYDIQPLLATSPFSAKCLMMYGGRTYILMRKKPYLLFNRTWDEYRNGFGNIAEDYWLGLEQIYLLTNSFSDIMLKVQIKKPSLQAFQQFYYNFRVSDEASLYCLNFSFSTPNSDKQRALGDSLKPGLGAPFSTHDRDNDGDVTVNCAERHQSGWWFPSSCNETKANPLGRLEQGNSVWSGKAENAFWWDDLGDMAPYTIEMWLVRYS